MFTIGIDIYYCAEENKTSIFNQNKIALTEVTNGITVFLCVISFTQPLKGLLLFICFAFHFFMNENTSKKHERNYAHFRSAKWRVYL